MTYASGDRNPTNGQAQGFDSIFDKPNFAGGDFSFWNRQGIRLLNVGVSAGGKLARLARSSKIQGQANFVNPGLVRLHGLEAEVTLNCVLCSTGSYLRFATVQPLQHFLQQPKIGHDIGFDLQSRAPLSPASSTITSFLLVEWRRSSQVMVLETP